MIVIPVVNRIANNWTTGRVLRLNLVDEINKAYAESREVVDTPTFILYDESGVERVRWVGQAPALEDLP